MKLWGEDCSEDEEGDADKRNPFERDYSLGDFVLHRGELLGESERWTEEIFVNYKLNNSQKTKVLDVDRVDSTMQTPWCAVYGPFTNCPLIGLLIIYLGLLNILIRSLHQIGPPLSGCFLIIEKKSPSLQTLTRNIDVVYDVERFRKYASWFNLVRVKGLWLND